MKLSTSVFRGLRQIRTRQQYFAASSGSHFLAIRNSSDLVSKMASNDKSLTESYEKIAGNFTSKAEYDEVRKKRLIYRAKQRGWLEADILLGSWAKEYVPSLSDDELDQFETVLKEETIDVYNYVSGKDELPPHLSSLPIMKRLQEYAMQSSVIDPDSYALLKKRNNLI